jgi:ABC-type multidrug transport system fused ATPase/permease subunit
MSIPLPDGDPQGDPQGQSASSGGDLGGDGGVNVEQRVAFLRTELDRQQQRFAHRRRRDKRKSFVLQMATVALSATITVLLGLRVAAGLQRTLANIALVLGALVTVLAAMEAFFNHRGLWVSRTVTVRRLEELRRQTDYQLAGLADGEVQPAIVDGLLARLEEIVADDQQAWLRLRSTEPQPFSPGQDTGTSSMEP